MKWIGQWWRRRMRRIDADVLFPKLLAGASSDLHLAVAIAMHVRRDSAWRYPNEWKDEWPELHNLLEIHHARNNVA